MAFAITGPNSVILNQGESKPCVLQILKAAKPWRNVGLTVSGLPNGVTAEFFPSNGKPSFNSTMTLRSADNSITGDFTIIVTARDARSSDSMPILLTNFSPNVPGVTPPSAPVLSSLSPSSITEDTGAFTLTVNGTGFVSGAVVSWNGSSRTTTFVNSGQVTAAILSGDITTPGTASVTATNPGSSASNTLTFTINAAAGFTADVWVGGTGASDSNDGLAQTVGGGHGPKATINAGMAILGQGQRMAVRAGTYVEKLTNPTGGNSEGNRKTIIGYPGETAIMRPSGGTSDSVINFEPSTNQYLTIDNITIDATNVANGCKPTADNGGIPFFTLQNFEIIGQTARDGEGILCGTASDLSGAIIIQNGSIHDHGPPATNQSHGIYFANGRGTIYNLDIYNVSGYGLQIYPNANGVTIHRCKIHNCGTGGSAAGVILSGQNNLAYNCLVYGNTGNGMDIAIGGGSNNRSYNNTFYNNSGYAMSLASISNSILRNNICRSNGSGDINDSGTSTTKTNNWLVADGDPLFVSPGTGNFHLQSSSTAKTGGFDLSGTFTIDYDGVSRPQGATYSRGAFEYV